jgi:predicted O-methyltransferase YrrM
VPANDYGERYSATEHDACNYPGYRYIFNIMLKVMRVTKILEIATSAGCSTLWFADAILQSDITSKAEIEKSIITIDMNHSKVLLMRILMMQELNK